MATATETKFCPYCGRKHHERGRACSDYCGRKVSAHLAACTAGRNRARDRIMAKIQKRERHRGRWRQIAMGRDVGENLRMIFGVDVPAEPPPYVGFSGSDEP